MCATDIEYEPCLGDKHTEEYQIIILAQFQGFGAIMFTELSIYLPYPQN